MEWDYVNLSLVEELSPTPAHNCQEGQTVRNEGRRERRSRENEWERGEAVISNLEREEQNEQPRDGSLEEKERPEADGEEWRWKEMSGIGDNEEERGRQTTGEAESGG